MATMEKLELEQRRRDIDHDVRELVEKYRAIFGWDIPEIDQALADGLILMEMRAALDQVEKTLVH